MIKQFFKISFYSFITFCVVNFIILVFSLLMFSLLKEIPEIHIGFPFNFYNLICINESFLYGSDLNNLIYDSLFFWLLIFLFFQFKNQKTTTLLIKMIKKQPF